MFHRVLVTLAFVLGAGGFLLAFLSQRYWFARAWRVAGLLRSPLMRKGLRALVVSVTSVLALLCVVSIVGNQRGVVSFGSWWNALLGLWLSSSIVSYLFVKAIAVMEWAWRQVRRAVSIPQNGRMAKDMGAAQRSVPSVEGGINPSRRNFFRFAGVLAGALPFATAIYGFASERLRFQVREVEIPIPNLPPGLEGLRIAQLSDIHVGSYMPVDQVRRAVGIANELRGDLTVVTGDFLTTRNDPLEACIAELSNLRAPLGVWGCNGNHEIYAGVQQEAQELFHRFGMRLLRQENAELRWEEAPST
jgi:hypothetical protein